MNLEQWIRSSLQSSVRDPWPTGNAAFCGLLDQVIEQRTAKLMIRHRATGTSVLLMSAAIYAVSQRQAPYALLLYRDRLKARLMLDIVDALADEAGLYVGRRNRRAIELTTGGRIECRSMGEGLRGLVAYVDRRVVRPAVILLDMETRPRSAAREELLRDQLKDVRSLHSRLSPCGIATVTTDTGWL